MERVWCRHLHVKLSTGGVLIAVMGIHRLWLHAMACLVDRSDLAALCDCHTSNECLFCFEVRNAFGRGIKRYRTAETMQPRTNPFHIPVGRLVGTYDPEKHKKEHKSKDPSPLH